MLQVVQTLSQADLLCVLTVPLALPLCINKINCEQNISIAQKCQTCVVVAKQTVTNNIYMEEVCISAASQSTACLSLHQSKDNEGSPHCNYQTMSLSVTSH